MHYSYFLAMYVIRYWNRDESAGIVLPKQWADALDNWTIQDYFLHVGLAIITYMIWSAYYYMRVFVWEWKKIEKRK